MPKHIYDKEGNYKGKILSDEEHQEKQASSSGFVLYAFKLIIVVICLIFGEFATHIFMVIFCSLPNLIFSISVKSFTLDYDEKNELEFSKFMKLCIGFSNIFYIKDNLFNTFLNNLLFGLLIYWLDSNGGSTSFIAILAWIAFFLAIGYIVLFEDTKKID